MSTPDTSGAFGLVAAGVASASAAIQYVWRQQGEREREEKKAVEARVKVLEEKAHAQELVLTRQDGDLTHMREAIDDMRGMLFDQRPNLRARGCAVAETDPIVDRRITPSLDHFREPRDRPHPPRPVAFQESLAKGLRQVGDNSGA